MNFGQKILPIHIYVCILEFDWDLDVTSSNQRMSLFSNLTKASSILHEKKANLVVGKITEANEITSLPPIWSFRAASKSQDLIPRDV